ncbi:MAG: hypothetical protein LUO93_09390 [Methanomicrobiales archaeon]|nr:hypothetical protein [Methanomicrobiales archaeon]
MPQLDPAEEKRLKSELFLIDPDSYGPNFHEHLLEMYKVYMEMADHVSQRRDSANNFFVTLNSAIIALIGIVASILTSSIILKFCWVVVISVTGIIICVRWRDIIQSHKDLNSGKFVIIHMLEEKLPATLYKTEWSYLNPPIGRKRYKSLTLAELQVPLVFIGLYTLIMSICIVLILFFRSLLV